MPKKKSGFPYEVYPTPAKGKDGGNIVYARPAKGRSQVDTHNGINQIEPVGTCTVERARQKLYNLVDDPMEEGSYSSKETHDECEDDHERPLTDMLHPPLMQPLKHRRSRCCHVFHYFLIIVTSPFSFNLMMADGV